MKGNVKALQLIFGIHRATHRIGLYIQKHAPELNQAEAHILCHLHETGDSPISELHRAFAHKRSTLTSVLDRMDARGLVHRLASPTDRRSFIVMLTKQGKKEAAKIHRILEKLESGVLGRSDTRKVRSFCKLLGELEALASGAATK